MNLERAVSSSKRIEMGFSLVQNGRFIGPPPGGFKELGSLFPTTFGVEVFPPFLIIRVRTLPPRPWPLAVAGMPLRLTVHETDDCFDRGCVGRGPKVLQNFHLQRHDEFSEEILKGAITSFRDLHIRIHDIAWFGAFWRITVPDGTDLKTVPSFIAHHGCYYKFRSEVTEGDPAALRANTPQGIEFDDFFYAKEVNALLRPGIMLSSSSRSTVEDGKINHQYKSTTSGILIIDRYGNKFITVATHGFESDGLVWHPTPEKGKIIGKIVDQLPGTDISIAKLNSGLRYTNETFGTRENPSGVQASGISPNYPPHTLVGDAITMDNPFSGFCEGQIMALGTKILGEGAEHIPHKWMIFENGDEPIDGSCGTAILDEEKRVVGFFRYKLDNSGRCYAVSAMELRNHGYEIFGGEQTL